MLVVTVVGWPDRLAVAVTITGSVVVAVAVTVTSDMMRCLLEGYGYDLSSTSERVRLRPPYMLVNMCWDARYWRHIS